MNSFNQLTIQLDDELMNAVRISAQHQQIDKALFVISLIKQYYQTRKDLK